MLFPPIGHYSEILFLYDAFESSPNEIFRNHNYSFLLDSKNKTWALLAKNRRHIMLVAICKAVQIIDLMFRTNRATAARQTEQGSASGRPVTSCASLQILRGQT